MSGRPSIHVFDAWNVRQAATDELALEAAERAFEALARGTVTVPSALSWEFPSVHGEAHIKGAYLHGSPFFTLKVATGFYGNVEMGVPTGSGMVLIFDARSGFPLGVLADNGYLTDLRTAAAGALAVRHLAPDRPLVAALVGSGAQAKLQLRLIARERELKELRVWSRTASHIDQFRAKMQPILVTEIRATDSVGTAVADADLVVTVTPSRAPLVEAGWLKPGVTVVAVGSDVPVKQELESRLLAEADKLVTDLTEQCTALGELHHALADGLMNAEDVYAELGEVVTGAKAGREGDETIVCDLTGVGAQDAAIAEVVFMRLAGITPEDEV